MFVYVCVCGTFKNVLMFSCIQGGPFVYVCVCVCVCGSHFRIVLNLSCIQGVVVFVFAALSGYRTT